MKFAKELDDDLVPEWRSKYFNYKPKGGKKRIKAVARALRDAHRTPTVSSTFLRPDASQTPDPLPYTLFEYNARKARKNEQKQDGTGGPTSLQGRRKGSTRFAESPPVLIPNSRPGSQIHSSRTSPEGSPEEDTPLQPARSRSTRYGSIIGTPPNEPTKMPTLDLPDPALTPLDTNKQQAAEDELSQMPPSVARQPTPPTNTHAGRDTAKGSLARRMFMNKKPPQPSPASKPHTFSKSNLRQIFLPHHEQTPAGNDVQLEAYEKLDARQDEFFNFLDKELKKIEEFYKFKEDEANDRLRILRKQLHELRDHRLEEVRQLERGAASADHNEAPTGSAGEHKASLSNGYGVGNISKPIGDFVTGKSKIGRVTESLQQTASPTTPSGHATLGIPVDQRADFVRRQHHAPSYRVAKRRLKLAMQEYYRGLELLKSYSLLNQTAFRKINKKYDKAINARPPLRYYSEYVQEAYFVKSDVIGNHMMAVEDLYSRYFEKGNHKVAVGKLRSKLKDDDYSGVTFRNGLWLAAGSCLGIAGLVEGVRLLFNSQGALKTQTSYLLQLYAGYFLALLLGLAFVLNCRIWKRNRINYAFVFEFDPRHTLDWRQLAEPPCFFTFLLGVFMYINFRQPTTDVFFLYWPVILIGITLVLMAIPVKILYPHARQWWAYSNWRLLCAGLYPVEFRDFYLGDMYTSSSYSMSQVSLFFCLYSSDWNDPPHCNSNHSRLLGFFTAFPSILRAFQCLRRFVDSGNWFPHMANFAKYCGNVMYYTSLSLYRIDMSYQTRAAFITFAAVNSIYCSVWDIFMDWSLGDWVQSNNKFLRPRLAFKQRRVYYLAMIVDVILRQQWIVYAIFVEDLQHSSAASFFVALAEVFRRGMWSIFRVENEHCNNVDKFRAYRDVPLPYKLPTDEQQPSSQMTSIEHRPEMWPMRDQAGITATGADIERPRPDAAEGPSPVRQRFRGLARVASAIASAHGQDYEKKKRPAGQTPEDEPLDPNESSDEDDDDHQHHGNAEDEFRPSTDVQDAEDIAQARNMISRATGDGF